MWTVDDVAHVIKRIFKTFQLAGCSTGCVTGCIVYTHLKKPKHVTCQRVCRDQTTHMDMHGWSYPQRVIYSRFHQNQFRGFEATVVEICPFPLLWLLAFTTPCISRGMVIQTKLYIMYIFLWRFIEYFFIVFHITRLCRLMTFVGLIVGNKYFENTITTVYTVLSCKLCNDCILMTSSLQLCILGYWVVLVN